MSDDNVDLGLNGKWIVEYFIDNAVKIIKTDENTWSDIENINITANFINSDNSNGGIVTGIRATNNYTGSYEFSLNGEISFKDLGSTKINEPKWTDLYKLDKAEHYEINNDKLIIYYNDRNNAIVFIRE